jgi:geranylgeranyl diphosphate synthase type II
MIESRAMLSLSLEEGPPVVEAMIYSLQAGGKRIRPVLCMLAAESVGASAESALSCAAALEYVHTYSLIHDDLPAMDDDDIRRGKPTCHIMFGEGQAILAGDGLLTEAFVCLASDISLSPLSRLEAVRILGEAAGWRGMVGGQSLDLRGEDRVHTREMTSIDELKIMHQLKTGALLRASMELGAIAGNASQEQRQILRLAGESIGLAFQIKDDILDATSTEAHMGKRVGKDVYKGKITYPILLGISEANDALHKATKCAITLLQLLPRPRSLTALTAFLAERLA